MEWCTPITDSEPTLSVPGGWQTAVDTPAFPPIGRARLTMIILTVAYMLSFVDRQILSLLVEPMKHDLHITDFQVSLLQGLAFSAIFSLAGIPLGRLADYHNRRNIVIAGVTVWSGMTALCGVVTSFAALFIGRAGVGIGEAALTPSACSLLSDYFPSDKLPRAMAVYLLAPATGTGLAYMLGGVILSHVGASPSVDLILVGEVKAWQVPFLAVGCFGIVVILLLAMVREPLRRATTNLADEKYSLLEVLGFFCTHWRSLGAVTLGMSMMGMQGYAVMSWLPSMLLRTFNAQLSNVGWTLGSIYIATSVAGSLGGAWCASRLRYKVGKNPYILWVLGCAAMLTLASLTLPLCATLTKTYLSCGVMFLWQAAWAGVLIAAIQLAVPSQMRATLTAMTFLFTNLLSLSLGPSSVAALTQFLFHDPLSLRYSITIVSVVAGSLAMLSFTIALKHFPVLNEGFAAPPPRLTKE